MNREKPLSDLYHQYITGELPRKDLEGGIYQHLMEHYDKYHIFRGNQDRWDEFLSWLYPRISSAIDRYQEQGSTLDAYINGLVNGASKEYLRLETNHYLTEYACWQARAEEMMLYENEASYNETADHRPIPLNFKPRQVLFLLLKSYFFANDELVERVAKTNGMKPEELRNIIEELRKKRSNQETEILDLKDRLQCQYYRCLAYQKRMKNAIQGTDSYDIMKDRFERARIRFYSMKKRLEGMRKGASNRMIAEVLKVPKGTIDSGLFAIKNYLLTAGVTE